VTVKGLPQRIAALDVLGDVRNQAADGRALPAVRQGLEGFEQGRARIEQHDELPEEIGDLVLADRAHLQDRPQAATAGFTRTNHDFLFVARPGQRCGAAFSGPSGPLYPFAGFVDVYDHKVNPPLRNRR